MEKIYSVYMMTNWDDSVLYIGVTNDLKRRIYEHKNKLIKGFTSRYNIHKLVYFQVTQNIESAIIYEKQLKSWRREKKNSLVLEFNPEWKDLSDILG